MMPSRVYEPSLDESDPLSKALSPPPDESEEQMKARLQHELEAKKVSDAIDEDIDRERAAEKKAPKPIRVLLLGQSESGKSTLLKSEHQSYSAPPAAANCYPGSDFQLQHDPKAFSAERASWRAVIQLNVVRSIHVILDAITYPSQPRPRASPKEGTSTSSSPLSSELPLPDETEIDPEILEIRSRLSPLLKLEDILTRQLTPTDYSEVGTTELAPSYSITHVPTELALNSAVPWKQRFDRLVGRGDTANNEPVIDWDDPNEPGNVLHSCGEDMIRLWKHPLVQQLLDKQNLRLEEMAGFFLDSLSEVTVDRYLPSNEHILRARLKTLGVSEHRVKVSAGATWRIYDVGGHRSLRGNLLAYHNPFSGS
ncbi:hypothetical protein D9757_003820 [Collybiopsis confluens]|uniref:Uncharacterized protein n=1 Tax=Collybiopsis confluens TaxID=2823264 RepID=A0A8H5HVN4_9AGAR|nr:hypothetical protein D9757_003820 [Collybiopsis confluens]